MTLARRRSGGGTVYHDPGNLCFSFISSSKDFDRRANASLVADALKGTFNLNAHVNERNDIFVNKTSFWLSISNHGRSRVPSWDPACLF
mmetsp:Transcript_8566/g.25758  ORF Transcript_8566/g.25758 Transcript_8566/m.25758 type:complete len:89 (+) Transcript_8566:55-321(+)